jgi:hypothetical protein
MGLILQFVLLAVALGVLGTFAAWQAGKWTGRRVLSVAKKGHKVLPGPVTQPFRAGKVAKTTPGEDLLAYPQKLEGLERQLEERLELLGQQERVVEARGDELRVKGGRDELTMKYREDLELLRQRSRSMRRVLGKVWKTRSIRLLRAHLAETARQKPSFSALPEPGAKPTPAQLQRATGSFYTAAASVRSYLDAVVERRRWLAGILPEKPVLASLDDADHQAVAEELAATEQSYAVLLEQMDRLADNLTYLGDHYATVAAVVEGPDSRVPEASAARMLEEVERAIDSVERLAHAVDPGMVDAAVDHLSRDITRLEQAGQEVSAEAEASLEVEALLKQS